MKNKRILFISVIAVIISLILCFTIREWSPKALGSDTLHKISLSDLPDAGENVYWRMDYFQSEADVLTEQVLFDGYALCLTEKPNDSRTVELLFISDKNAWAISAVPEQYNLICLTGERLNNYAIFESLFQDFHFNVSDRYGFAANFSTLNMPNGSYELGIHVTENEVDWGFTRTGLMFVKKNRSFTLLPSKDIVPEDFDPKEADTKDVSGEIEHAQLLGNGSSLIEGWISANDYNENEGHVILEISDSLGTKILFDPDQHLPRILPGKETFTHTDGFRAIIPSTAGFSGEIIIRAFIQMPDGKLFMIPSDRALLL